MRKPIAAAILCAALWPGGAVAAQWGSCNVVQKHSTCIDYSGSYWHGNTQAMTLHCQGYGATLSRQACPTVDPWDDHRFGTCIYNQFQPFEFMSHFYTLGGGGFDDMAKFKATRDTCRRIGGTWNWGPRSGLMD